MVVVARSTAALRAPEDLARIAWEREGLYATAEAGGHIAAISGYMRHHLTTAYGIPGSALISLTNGLTRADWHTTPPGTFELTCPRMNSPQLSNGTPRWPDEPKTFKKISSWEVWPSSTGRAPSLDTVDRLAQIYVAKAVLSLDIGQQRAPIPSTSTCRHPAGHGRTAGCDT